MIGTFSKGILNRRLLPIAMGNELVACRRGRRADRLSGIIGWGLKDNTQNARCVARRHGLPYFCLEDGFVRSVGLGVTGSEPFGFIVDRQGIYYNARQPSDVEDLIRAGEAADTPRAARLIKRLVELQVSKYNHVWDSPALPKADRPNILLIDQTRGDLSVAYGLADEYSFGRMVDAAVQRYPQARFFVKTHPDVIAGKKRGYLTGKLPPEVRLISQDCNPIALLQQVDHVYTVTSQMGFEALLAGKRVTCFGMPFYAGWGLTQDMLSCPRRGMRRSLEQVFAAAYLQYTRYVDPVTEQACELERILDLIENHKRVAVQNRGTIHCFNFRWWKRGIIKQFLGSADTAIFFPRQLHAQRQNRRPPPSRIVVWGAAKAPLLCGLGQGDPIAVERVEDGFIRSVGLGSDFAKPTSLILDRRGIYFDPRQPSDLEDLLNTVELDDASIGRARRLRRRLVDSGISKYNTGACNASAHRDGSTRVILVPGQVEDDASIQTGCIDVRTNLDLLKAVRQARPEAHVIFKPHPDVVAGNRVGAIPAAAARTLCDEIVTDCDITACLERVDEVHTMTSLTGFEALLRGKTVHTYGLPFYAGWGLTRDRHACERRRRRRCVDELLYCALFLYPRYYHWRARMFIGAEDAVEDLIRAKTRKNRVLDLSWRQRLARKAGNLLESSVLLLKS